MTREVHGMSHIDAVSIYNDFIFLWNSVIKKCAVLWQESSDSDCILCKRFCWEKDENTVITLELEVKRSNGSIYKCNHRVLVNSNFNSKNFYSFYSILFGQFQMTVPSCS